MIDKPNRWRWKVWRVVGCGSLAGTISCHASLLCRQWITPTVAPWPFNTIHTTPPVLRPTYLLYTIKLEIITFKLEIWYYIYYNIMIQTPLNTLTPACIWYIWYIYDTHRHIYVYIIRVNWNPVRLFSGYAPGGLPCTTPPPPPPGPSMSGTAHFVQGHLPGHNQPVNTWSVGTKLPIWPILKMAAIKLPNSPYILNWADLTS